VTRLADSSGWTRLEDMPIPCPAPLHDSSGVALVVSTYDHKVLIARPEQGGVRLELVPPAGRVWVLVDELAPVTRVPEWRADVEDGAEEAQRAAGFPVVGSPDPIVPWGALRALLALGPALPERDL
jgi:hypothetical protein